MLAMQPGEAERTPAQPSAADEVRLVLSTAPDRACAEELAQALVESRLAACVSILPDVTSVYRWEGTVERASELMLVVKTRAASLPALERFLAERHPYSCPEQVALAPREVEARYRAWLLAQTDGA